PTLLFFFCVFDPPSPPSTYTLSLHALFRSFNTALNEIPPPSLRQIIRRLSYSEATIYRHFPELCRQISQRYAEYRTKRAMARKADRKSTRLNSSHGSISYAVFCLKKKTTKN